MLHRDFYFKYQETEFDTLNWEDIERKLTDTTVVGHKTPKSACELLAAKRRKSFVVQEVTAMSLAVIKDLGYDVFAITQWNAHSESSISVSDSSSYSQREFRSDYGWEYIDSVSVASRPDKINPEYGFEICFRNTGKAAFKGKELVDGSNRQFIGIAEGLVLKMRGGSVTGRSEEDLMVRRKINRIYLVAPVAKKPSQIVSEIETTMDKLKLDISYKPPVIKEVSCAGK